MDQETYQLAHYPVTCPERGWCGPCARLELENQLKENE